MEKDLISIIVPIYNTIEYLPRCVESLRAQTYRNIEIVLVDDGSTDESGKYCDRMSFTDGRIHVYHKPNGGSSSARNLGIEKAMGEYIGFVDSDDYVEPDMYERLLLAIREHGTNAAQVGRDEITPEGDLLPDICTPPEEARVVAPEEFMEELLMHRGDCSFCTKLIRKDILLQAEEKFPMGILNEDFHFLVRILRSVGDIVSLPGHSYHVVYRLGSNSRKEDKENFSRVYGDCVDNADMVVTIVETEYPDLLKCAFRFGIFQRLEYLLHIPISQMNSENEQYREIVTYMRKNWLKTLVNPILTGKNKCYHTLFAIAPRGIRKVHAKLKHK